MPAIAVQGAGRILGTPRTAVAPVAVAWPVLAECVRLAVCVQF